MGRSLLLCVLFAASPLWGATGPSLSLEQARRQALEHNPLLRVAQEQVAEVRAAHLQTWAGFLPQVRLTEQVVRSTDAVSAFGFKLAQENFTQGDFALDALNRPDGVTDFQTSLDLRQPLINGGAIFRRRLAAASLRAAQATLQRERQAILLQTSQAYWDMVLAEARLAALSFELATAAAQEKMIEAHHRQDMASLADLLAAQVRVAQLKQQQIEETHQLASAAEQLALVLGFEGEELAASDTFKTDLPVGRLAQLEAAADQRPDLVAARQQAEAMRQGIGAARSERLPRLDAFARIGLNADRPFARQGESWTAGATITWELFSGLGTTAAVRQAEAQEGQAAARLVFLRRQIRRQVRQAHRGVLAAKSQIEVAGKALGQAREQRRVSRLQHGEGVVTAADLLAAEAGTTQAHLRYLEALHRLNVGVARLQFAVGAPLPGWKKTHQEVQP